MSVEIHLARSRVVFVACFALALLVPSGQLVAQPIAGKSQPDRLDFGSVRVDATAEGSIRVFEDGDKTTGITFNVVPPPFVVITNVELGTQTYGNLGKKIVCDVSLAINTQKVGEHVGTLVVEVGKQKTAIPVRVKVQPSDPSATSILIVETPFDRFSTDDATVFDPWLRLVASEDLDAHYLDVQRDQPVLREIDLSKFDVILLGESGVISLLESDIDKLKQFVTNGGRLLVTANAFYRGTVAKANELLNLAGLRMGDTEPRGANFFVLKEDDICSDPLTREVLRVKCSRPSPIEVTDRAKGRILIKAPPYPEQGFLAAGRYGSGEIIAIGQSLWWNWIGGARYQGSDNQQLLQNLIANASE